MEKEKKYCVYKHTNKVNGKVYIGQTCRKPEYRWSEGKGYIGCTHFYNAIQKYGWDSFDHEIIYENLSLEEANRLEAELICLYSSTDSKCGYNMRPGGLNSPLSEDTKEKISQAIVGENNGFYGKHHTEETKRKISEAQKGENNCNYGKHFCMKEEIKRKISETKKGVPLSEANRQNISLAMQGSKNPNCKAIICIETGEKFWGAKEAQDKLGVNKESISACCHGRNKTAGGYHWKFVEDNNN